MHPLVTLTTDFGTRDSYTAELKGVLYSEGPPDLRVVDLSHELPPFDVEFAARFVQRAVSQFPPETVHVVVVDPGVGSARQPLVVEVGRKLLVGPDNGVFSLLFDGSERVFALDPARASERVLSSTFHGRDLFAPAAARLAGGAPCTALGTLTRLYERLQPRLPEREVDGWLGQITHVDRYGNLITNITASELAALGDRAAVRVECAGAALALRAHYAEVAPGELLCLVGSSGQLELSARETSAAEKLAAGVGSCVRVTKRG
jgi:S-adenosylmethionine hydrolase